MNEMVQVLLDYRHLARSRLVSLERQSEYITAKFEVSSRVAPCSQLFTSTLPQPQKMARHLAVQAAWLDILGTQLEQVRTFVRESAKRPEVYEDLDLFPLGTADDVDAIDVSLLDGQIDGDMIEPGSISTDQVIALNAEKLIGKMRPDLLIGAGVTFDHVDGQIDGNRLVDGSVHSQHIASVDASTIVGVLQNATVAPLSIRAEHIHDVPWSKVEGPPPDTFTQGLDLALMGGVLRDHQLPRSIPANKLDPASQLDLELFSSGTLRGECIAPKSIYAKHIAEVDAACITGRIDGSMLLPGSVPASAIVDVNAASIFGDMKLDKLSCDSVCATDACIEDLDAGSIECKQLHLQGELSCTRLAAAAVTCDMVTADSAEAARFTCDELATTGLLTVQGLVEASDIRIAQSARADHIVSKTLDATELCARTLDSTTVKASNLNASHADIGELIVQKLNADVSAAHAFESRVLQAQTVEAATLSCGTLSSETLDIKRLSTDAMRCVVFECKDSIVDTVETQQLTIEGDLSAATVACSSSLTAQNLEVAATIKCKDIKVSDVRATDIETTALYTDILRSAELTAIALFVQDVICDGSMRFDSLQCDTANLYSLGVADIVTAQALVAEKAHVSVLETDTAQLQDLICRSLSSTVSVLDSVRADDMTCQHVHSQHTQVQELETIDLATETLEVNDLRCKTFQIEDRLSTTELDTDEIILHGTPLTTLLSELEERITRQTTSQNAGRPLLFEKVVYRADTQYDTGHDVVKTMSAAFPLAQITVQFVSTQTYGLSLSSNGAVSGKGTSEGLHGINVEARVQDGPETHTLQRELTFDIAGPPYWNPQLSLEAVRAVPFSLLIVADNATSFQDTDPRLIGVGMVGERLRGVVADPGVYAAGIKAFRLLEYNGHVLESSARVPLTVRPQAPMLNAPDLESITQIAGTYVTLDAVFAKQDLVDVNVLLQLYQKRPKPLPVVWQTPTEVLTDVQSFSVPLVAAGAQSYSVASRATLPIAVHLTNGGVLQGFVELPRTFEVGVRAHGSVGNDAGWEQGGHADRLFIVTVRPLGVQLLDFGNTQLTAGRTVTITLYGTVDTGCSVGFIQA